MAEGKVGETLTFKHGLHGLRESWGNLDIKTWPTRTRTRTRTCCTLVYTVVIIDSFTNMLTVYAHV